MALIDKDQIITQFVKFVVGFMGKNAVEPTVSVTIPLDNIPETPAIPTPIDWTSPDCKITEHFTVADACMLHSWNRLANDMDGFTDGMKARAIVLCQKMEEVRTLLGCPMNVHCMFRSMQYNVEQKILLPTGADVHSMMIACDFDANSHMTTDQVKEKLLPKLEYFGIRMEDNGAGASWVHLDLHSVMHNRFFKT